MNEQLKYIVETLNQPPFSKRLTLIAFDSLEPAVLLQVLNDVLAEVSPDDRMDLREEAPDQTAYRMLTLLHLLKYKPPGEPSEFRKGLVCGDKVVILPLLHWLLRHLPELKTRAYLSKYLTKIEVPPDIMQDDTVADVYQQYVAMLDEFKEVHKAGERVKSSGFSVLEVRRDIASMEEEKEKLQRRIERLEKKAAALPKSERLLEAARRLRAERDREVELGETLQREQTHILHAQHKTEKLSQQLKDLQLAGTGLNGEAVLEKLGEDHRINSNLVHEVLPMKITTQRQACQELEMVLNDPATSETDLQKIHEQIEEAAAEATALMEKHMPSNDPVQSKIALFRQQANIIANKRVAAQDSYRAAMEELVQAEAELKAKQTQLRELGGELLKEEEFKRYCSKLRTLSNTYKKKKADLSSVKAECGVLSRSETILQSQNARVQQMYSDMEERAGVAGFRVAQSTLEKVSSIKGEIDEKKGQTLQDMAETLKELNERIASKKAALAPIIRELRPLRERDQQLSAEHAEKKRTYESILAGLEGKRSELEREVWVYREECLQEESRYHYLQAMVRTVALQQQRIAAEMKTYTSGESGKQKTLRDQYTRKIHEQENVGRALRDKKKEVSESHPHAVKQVKLWANLQKLLECKRDCLLQSQVHRAQAAAAQQAILAQEDRLVLS